MDEANQILAEPYSLKNELPGKSSYYFEKIWQGLLNKGFRLEDNHKAKLAVIFQSNLPDIFGFEAIKPAGVAGGNYGGNYGNGLIDVMHGLFFDRDGCTVRDGAIAADCSKISYQEGEPFSGIGPDKYVKTKADFDKLVERSREAGGISNYFKISSGFLLNSDFVYALDEIFSQSNAVANRWRSVPVEIMDALRYLAVTANAVNPPLGDDDILPLPEIKWGSS